VTEVSFSEALKTWAKIGVLSFGGPAGQIAMMHRILVDEKKWLSEQRYLHALNFCMLLPGPEAMQLATYAGWSLHGWRGEAAFRTWLVTIASNLLKDQFRRRRGRTVVPIEEGDLVAQDDPSTTLDALETERKLIQGLATLPRLQREVFLLRAQQGMEYGEIAQALDTTAGAARVHYHNAVKRLKELVA